MTVKVREKIGTFEGHHIKPFYQDKYATISFLESVPCIKVKLVGVPQSSEHYQSINNKILEAIAIEKRNYCRLHLLTDSSHAGIVLDEDYAFYKQEIIPQLEKHGIRYHAVVLPESSFVRSLISPQTISSRKIEVEYFNNTSGASKWLRHR